MIDVEDLFVDTCAVESGCNRSYRVPWTRFIELIVGLKICQVFFSEPEDMCEKSISKSVVNVLNGDIRKKRQCHLLKNPCQRSDHKPNLVLDDRFDRRVWKTVIRTMTLALVVPMASSV